ncbi:MAG: zinc ribbon domain-containing protein [Ruminococcaceae bacterium]|nr:zinc ribbon domain-containing protein [Oscillospiraceae bacterium]
MAFCEKCGGQIADNMKFCDKCGAPVATQAANAAQPQQGYAYQQPIYQQKVSAGKGILNLAKSYLPANLTTPGDRTLHWIGLGSLAALAITYIVCFFLGMNEMCFPIAAGAVEDGEGANAIWMVIYFALNLAPLYFALKALKPEANKLSALIASAACFVVTILSLIIWGICEAGEFMEAVMEYSDSPNTAAWYFLNDSLCDAWYLKLILPLGAIFGFGIDYLVKKEK